MTEKTTLIINIERTIGEGVITKMEIGSTGVPLPVNISKKINDRLFEIKESSRISADIRGIGNDSCIKPFPSPDKISNTGGFLIAPYLTRCICAPITNKIPPGKLMVSNLTGQVYRVFKHIRPEYVEIDAVMSQHGDDIDINFSPNKLEIKIENLREPTSIETKIFDILIKKEKDKNPSLYSDNGKVIFPTDMEPVTPDKIKPGDLIVVSPKKGVIKSSACLNLVKDIKVNANGTFYIISIAYQRQEGFVVVYSTPYPIYVNNNTFAVLPESMRNEFVAKCIQKHPEIEYDKVACEFVMDFNPKTNDEVFTVGFDGTITQYFNARGKTFPIAAFKFMNQEAAKKASSAIKDKLKAISKTLYFKTNDTGTV